MQHDGVLIFFWETVYVSALIVSKISITAQKTVPAPLTGEDFFCVFIYGLYYHKKQQSNLW